MRNRKIKLMSQKMKNETNLPLKERISADVDEKIEQNKNLKMKENNEKFLRVRKDLQIQGRDAQLVPGVIRHTSCPDSYLAFYFKYE